MASNDSAEFLSDMNWNVLQLDPIETGDSAAEESSDSSQCIKFLINMTANFTRPIIGSEEEEEEGSLVPILEGRSISFRRTFYQPVDELTRDAIAKMLSEVHVPLQVPRVRFLEDEILDTGRGMASDGRQNYHQRFLCMNVKIDAVVDELPVPYEDDYYMEDDDNSEGEDDDEDNNTMDAVRFVPASEGAIEGLQKVKVRMSDKSPTCPVCLEDILVGFEAIRLPCSHCYHGDCIVKWLRNSKFCPLCRFELPG